MRSLGAVFNPGLKFPGRRLQFLEKTVSMYNDVRAVTDEIEDERSRLLSAASQILHAQGPEGLSVRKVASAAGCSTMGVYTRFGGKPGLMDALYAEGFQILSDAQDQIQRPPGRGQVLAFCAIYRAVARSHPAHYALMMGGIPGYKPSAESAQLSSVRSEVLCQAVHEAQSLGEIPGRAPEDLTYALLAVCHGLVTFEVADMYSESKRGAQRFSATLTALLDGWSS
jgi:AcrR family transcriptional regulator